MTSDTTGSIDLFESDIDERNDDSEGGTVVDVDGGEVSLLITAHGSHSSTHIQTCAVLPNRHINRNTPPPTHQLRHFRPLN